MCHPGIETTNSSFDTASSAHQGRFTVQSDEAELPVLEVRPEEPSTGNVLIVHDIYGANDFYHDLARRLAVAGFTAYLPDLFVRQGPLPEQTREAARARGGRLSYPQAIEDIRRTINAIDGRSSGKTGAIGFCMGGTLVMLLAAREPRLAACVIYYGFPANPQRSDTRPYEPLEETSLIESPLLGFWGDQDQGVGMDNVERYKAGLDATGKPYDFTIYPGLPHGFLTFDPSSPYYEASQDSWRKTLEFLSQQLA